MTIEKQTAEHSVDVLVVGTGASGFTAAITARKAGLDVLLIEKDKVFGGTTATSGGVLWIPCNRHSAELGADSIVDARRYIAEEAGNHFNAARVDAFLKNGPEMVDFLERETEVQFYPMVYPDYHPSYTGASTIRSIGTVDYRADKLGAELKNLKYQLPQTLFLGLAVGSNVEMKQLMSAGRSVRGLAFVARKFGLMLGDVVRYGRSEPMVRGRALIARLARTAIDLGIPLWLSAPATELLFEDGRVAGALVTRDGRTVRVRARRGVVLASGGIPRDAARIAHLYPHRAAGRVHESLAAPGNVGDGARMAESVGGAFEGDVVQPAAWMPVSVIPGRQGTDAIWPHIVDRQKPGFLCVTPDGRRFTDESGPYHDFVPAMVEACATLPETCCWLICDHRTIRRYGMGFVKPAPIPMGAQLRSGYLRRAGSIEELGAQLGMDPAALRETIDRFNGFARNGVDPDFGRGGNIYDHSQGDDEHKPNPNLGPVEQGPFYAVKIVAGDIGSFAGLRTDQHARVLDGDSRPVAGLYAAGNDCLSAIAGGYAGAGGTLGPGMTFGYIAGKHLAAGAATP